MTEINHWIINVAKLKGLGFENAKSPKDYFIASSIVFFDFTLKTKKSK